MKKSEMAVGLIVGLYVAVLFKKTARPKKKTKKSNVIVMPRRA
jgi:hypothetical protein